MTKRKIIILQCIDFTDKEVETLKYQIEKLKLSYDIIITNKQLKAISIEQLIKILKKIK